MRAAFAMVPASGARCRCLVVLALLASAAGAGHAAGTALYDTGPASDSAFVRFVNALGHPAEVVPEGGQARLPLSVEKPVGEFVSIRPDTVIQGSFRAQGQRAAVAVKTAPGGFSSVVLRSAGPARPLTVTVLTETPDDFSALRASLGFASLDSACVPAGLQTAGKAVAIFSDVAVDQLQRRQVNPVALVVQATCGGRPVGQTLSLGQLQAGQRYSVFLLPAASGAPRLVFAEDTIAR